ncbi:MAG TPA: D-alanine--D-alanine ligase family protein [Thermoflexales bacterium]|nr:D-alanine--D-alanine ligase family protein [Thermoflexales bacterium]HQZ98877.1 D-alanine--D-alanine ligase family protein [Thermoflexales bacterium]
MTNEKKLRVAVLYGGKSGEHEVSLMSAGCVMEELDAERYEITPVFINKAGEWAIPMEQLREFDVVFPVLHGPNGEDGTVQGLLTVMGVPFVGAGVVGSAVAMDKVVFKDVMRANGLPVAPSVVVRRHEWQTGADAIRKKVATDIGYPCFAKPANMGSSVGITKVHAADELDAAIDEAFKWDRKILLEWAVPRARELEVSVLGNDELKASIVGEIVPNREFYTYAAKYLDKGEDESKLLMPAPIPEPLSALIREVAAEVATLADVRGMARVDFLLDGDANEIYINEINTIPGFTTISMYPKLWIESGMTYAGLLDTLIELAMES